MNTSLVTGAAGFLGSHLCERLLSEGHEVFGLDNFATGQRRNIELLKNPKFHFIEADVSQTWPSIEAKKMTWVFHFASPASPPHYQRLALETMRVNSLGLEKALNFADQKSARVVFASTSEIYGDPEISPQPESYWGRVNSYGERSCYDESKRYGEGLIFSWNKKFGTKHGLVRIFNTYGPRMNPEDGRVVINFIVQALQKKPLTIYGDGKQTRSFCFVSDLVDGILRYAATQETQPVNLGNDVEMSMLDLAKIVQRVVGETPIEFKPLPADDPKRRRPELSRAKKILHPWSPKISTEEGVKAMAQWLKEVTPL